MPAASSADGSAGVQIFGIRHLNIVRDGPPILFDVSLSIPARSIYTLIAPSGSGKSALLRALNRLAERPPGTNFFDGRDITAMDVLEPKRCVGIVFLSAAMLPGTLGDNLRYGPALRGEQVVAETIVGEHPGSLYLPLLRK